MNVHRHGRLSSVCAALAAVACGSGQRAPEETGSVHAQLASPPSAVQAVCVTVSGPAITGYVRADLTSDGGGHWSGTVQNVPAGIANRVVTAYAYSTATIPADPTSDNTGLIYKGQTSGVSVTAGAMSAVTITLRPFPNDSGAIGINTPPNIAVLSFPASIASNTPSSLSATAFDPDVGATLTYTWDDGGAGGAFSGGSNPAINQLPGTPVTIHYEADFVGSVSINLHVTDGTATVSTSFVLAVGSAVSPTLVFDAGPQITITSVNSQALAPGAQATISYQLRSAQNGGNLGESWTDSCGGTFDSYPSSVAYLTPGTTSQQVVYTAPAVAPVSPGECDLVVSVVDDAGASVWSKVVVWVQGS